MSLSLAWRSKSLSTGTRISGTMNALYMDIQAVWGHIFWVPVRVLHIHSTCRLGRKPKNQLDAFWPQNLKSFCLSYVLLWMGTTGDHNPVRARLASEMFRSNQFPQDCEKSLREHSKRCQMMTIGNATNCTYHWSKPTQWHSCEHRSPERLASVFIHIGRAHLSLGVPQTAQNEMHGNCTTLQHFCRHGDRIFQSGLHEVASFEKNLTHSVCSKARRKKLCVDCVEINKRSVSGFEYGAVPKNREMTKNEFSFFLTKTCIVQEFWHFCHHLLSN